MAAGPSTELDGLGSTASGMARRVDCDGGFAACTSSDSPTLGAGHAVGKNEETKTNPDMCDPSHDGPPLSVSLPSGRPRSPSVPTTSPGRRRRATRVSNLPGPVLRPTGRAEAPSLTRAPSRSAHWITSCPGGSACRLSLCVVHRRTLTCWTDRGARLRPLATRAGLEPASTA
jgi:hypothetical protein